MCVLLTRVLPQAPLVNAGVFYYHGVTPTDGAAWVAREVARRVHTFMWHPETVRTVVPWASEPFFANADEQTIMNDCVLSATAGELTYESTAEWEARMGGSKNRYIDSFTSETIAQNSTQLGGLKEAELKRMGLQSVSEVTDAEKKRLIAQSRALRRPLFAEEDGTEDELAAVLSKQLCATNASALGPTLRPVTRYGLRAIPMRSLAGDEQTPSADAMAKAASYLKNFVHKRCYGSLPRRRCFEVAPTADELAIIASAVYIDAPAWLFAHYPANFFYLRPTSSAKAPQTPEECTSDGGGAPDGLATDAPAGSATPAAAAPTTPSAAAGGGGPRMWEASKPPAVMLHMAGIRSGAWVRRGLMRAHGWWHASADALIIRDLGWGQSDGPLFLSQILGIASSKADAAMAMLPTPTPGQTDALVAGLFLIASLANRTLVMPDIACPYTSDQQAAWSEETFPEVKDRLVRVRGASKRCAWVPPQGSSSACAKLEYTAAVEVLDAEVSSGWVASRGAVGGSGLGGSAQAPSSAIPALPSDLLDGSSSSSITPGCEKLAQLLRAADERTDANGISNAILQIVRGFWPAWLSADMSTGRLLQTAVCGSGSGEGGEAAATASSISAALDGAFEPYAPLANLIDELDQLAEVAQQSRRDETLVTCVTDLIKTSKAYSKAYRLEQRRAKDVVNTLLPN